MGDILKIIFDAVKENFKKPSFYIFIVIAIYIISISFPYIESNYLYYIDMNKRVDLLEKIASLDSDLIESNDIIKKEYNDLLDKMKKHQISRNNYSYTGVVINDNIKFISGSFLPFLVMLFVPFMNTFKSNAQKVGAFIMMLIVSLIFGFLGMIIPTLPIGWLNYAIPIFIEIVFTVLLVSNTNRKKQRKSLK